MSANLAREAVLAGPRLLGRAPLAFLAWVALRIVEQVVALAILSAAPLAGMRNVGSVWASLASLPFEAVILAAMFRGLLEPKAKGFAWLRLSTVEFKMAGVLLLARLVGVLVAFLASIGVAYLAYFLQQKALAGSALWIGSAVAALALMRFAPVPAILVDERRVDLGEAWRATHGRYLLLAVIVLIAGALQRLLVSAPMVPGLSLAQGAWNGLLSPSRYMGLAWVSLIGVAALAVMAGAVVTVWRARER